MCERRAKQINVDLIDNFWNLPNWKKYFRYQVISANKLLKKFPIEVVLKALDDKTCKILSSINSPYLEKICKTIKIEKPEPTVNPKRIYNSKGEFSKKKTVLDKIDEQRKETI